MPYLARHHGRFTNSATLKALPRGVYELMGGKLDHTLLDQPALDLAFIDGIRLKADWVDVETSPGVYDWTFIDSALAQVNTKGKKCGLSVNGGFGFPAWLAAAPYNVPLYTIIDSGNDAGRQFPYPGDPTFATRWTSFITALGTRYDSNADILYTTIGGVGTHDEWFVASGTTDTINLGTTPTMNAWLAVSKQIIDAYKSAFPTTRICAALAKPFSNASGDSLMDTLADYALQQLGLQFGIGTNGLNATTVTSAQERINYIRAHWSHCATVAQFGLAGGGTQGIPVSEGVDQGLRSANALGLRCVEVYKTDCEDNTIYSYTAPGGATWNGASVAGTSAGIQPRRTDILSLAAPS